VATAPSLDKAVYPEEVTVRKASNGGYIVRTSGGKVSPYPGEEEVYRGLAGVLKCMRAHFADKEEDDKGDY
jgi:hypothetical protein